MGRTGCPGTSRSSESSAPYLLSDRIRSTRHDCAPFNPSYRRCRPPSCLRWNGQRSPVAGRTGPGSVVPVAVRRAVGAPTGPIAGSCRRKPAGSWVSWPARFDGRCCWRAFRTGTRPLCNPGCSSGSRSPTGNRRASSALAGPGRPSGTASLIGAWVSAAECSPACRSSAS
ncbi:hypothetical protein PBRA_001757 [Plasmodiophora brassicae]|uniref:Uncharacterized protein n=1 Tax=Plasmodiophora brassicae TaxID=37360 RepID=A0A0G4J047_PLABS|nr:hypothetical protein PBRA_001757 [Plasmodiophora brassicae]